MIIALEPVYDDRLHEYIHKNEKKQHNKNKMNENHLIENTIPVFGWLAYVHHLNAKHILPCTS